MGQNILPRSRIRTASHRYFGERVRIGTEMNTLPSAETRASEKGLPERRIEANKLTSYRLHKGTESNFHHPFF